MPDIHILFGLTNQLMVSNNKQNPQQSTKRQQQNLMDDHQKRPASVDSKTTKHLKHDSQSDNPKWIKYFNRTQQYKTMMTNLSEGKLPQSTKAEVAWDHYKHLNGFQKVSKAQFIEYFEKIKCKLIQKKIIVKNDEKAFWSDYTRAGGDSATQHQNGKQIYSNHPVSKLIEEDVMAEKHLNTTFDSFYASRPLYLCYERGVFRKLMRQADKKRKLYNYYDQKRAQTKAKTKPKNPEMDPFA